MADAPATGRSRTWRWVLRIALLVLAVLVVDGENPVYPVHKGHHHGLGLGAVLVVPVVGGEL